MVYNMEKKSEEQLWEENRKELSALIADLNDKLLEGQLLNPKVGFILNWSRGDGAYSMRLSKKRQIKEKEKRNKTSAQEAQKVLR